MPERIQLSRRKGWRKPDNTVVVSRPSKWGNPFAVHHTYTIVDATGVIVDYSGRRWIYVADATDAVALYRRWVTGQIRIVGFHRGVSVDEIRAELAGKNLACWCPLTDADGNRVPCHADVLLEIANQGETR